MYGMCKHLKNNIINGMIIEFENNWGTWERGSAGAILNFLNRITCDPLLKGVLRSLFIYPYNIARHIQSQSQVYRKPLHVGR